jgi:hypothetical protein
MDFEVRPIIRMNQRKQVSYRLERLRVVSKDARCVLAAMRQSGPGIPLESDYGAANACSIALRPH